MCQILFRSELQISEKLRLFVQPNFGYSFYSSEKLEQPFTLKPYRAGLGAGVLYSISHRG